MRPFNSETKVSMSTPLRSSPVNLRRRCSPGLSHTVRDLLRRHKPDYLEQLTSLSLPGVLHLCNVVPGANLLRARDQITGAIGAVHLQAIIVLSSNFRVLACWQDQWIVGQAVPTKTKGRGMVGEAGTTQTALVS